MLNADSTTGAERAGKLLVFIWCVRNGFGWQYISADGTLHECVWGGQGVNKIVKFVMSVQIW